MRNYDFSPNHGQVRTVETNGQIHAYARYASAAIVTDRYVLTNNADENRIAAMLPRETLHRAATEVLVDWGLLSNDPAERYRIGMLEELLTDVGVMTRMLYFKYSIADLCKTFCCSRDWIEDHILPSVRHIHLNHFFKMYVIDQNKDITSAERATLMKGHYFFSDTDLDRFWNEHATAMQKTKLIDIYDFSKSIPARAGLAAEKQRHSESKNSAKAKTRHLDRMRNLLK